VPEEPPITVVGAGPCGSFTALTIAREHVPVLVLEEHEEIGVPSHCAGHVGIKGLSRIGLDVPGNLVQNRIRGARFYSPQCRELVLDHRAPVTYVLDRPRFDMWIAEQATRYGATYHLGSRVRSIALERKQVRLIVESEDTKKLSCNLLVDAEGHPTALLRSARLEQIQSSKIVNGVSAEVENLTDIEDEFVELYFGKEYAPGFFAWIIPKGDGSAKVGLGAKGRDPISLLHRFISQHPVAQNKLRNSRILNVTAHPIPLGGPSSKTYANGLLEVGDAASQVKPTTGGGIVTGMICSQIAGQVATQAWKRSNYTTEFLSRYQFQWRKKIWKEFRMMTRIRTHLDRLSDEQMNNLFELAAKMKIMNDLRNFEDIDFQGSNLLSLAKHPRTMMNLVRFIWQALNQ